MDDFYLFLKAMAALCCAVIFLYVFFALATIVTGRTRRSTPVVEATPLKGFLTDGKLANVH